MYMYIVLRQYNVAEIVLICRLWRMISKRYQKSVIELKTHLAFLDLKSIYVCP